MLLNWTTAIVRLYMAVRKTIHWPKHVMMTHGSLGPRGGRLHTNEGSEQWSVGEMTWTQSKLTAFNLKTSFSHQRIRDFTCIINKLSYYVVIADSKGTYHVDDAIHYMKQKHTHTHIH